MKKITISNDDSYVFATRQFIEELKSYITDDVKVIITNGNLASVLADFADFKLNELKILLEPDENGRAKMYNLGKIFDIQIMVDPYMRWDDNRIILKGVHSCDSLGDDVIIDTIEVIDEEMKLI